MSSPMASPITRRDDTPSSSITKNLEFLNDTSTRLLNLKPDANGVVRVQRKDVSPSFFSLVFFIQSGFCA
jgi:hypothetical protein